LLTAGEVLAWSGHDGNGRQGLGRGIGLTEDTFKDLSGWLSHVEKMAYSHATMIALIGRNGKVWRFT
jgi:hypothetical protein